MNLGRLRPSRWTWFSPWMILGMVCILAGILFVLAIKNIHREERFMERALLSQANVLMRSLEAGSRTGMMGTGWGPQQIQLLVEETAQQPDVLYMAIVGSGGEVLAHSNPRLVGTELRIAAPEEGQISHRFVNEGQRAFEVVRSYQPFFRQRGGGSWDMCMMRQTPPASPGKFLILVGLDPKPFEEALAQDMHQTILLFGIMFLVGAAGFISLVWAQNFRTARQKLEDVEAFTSTIVKQMPIGMMATNPDGRIQKTNDAARAILGHDSDFIGCIEDYSCFMPVVQRLRRDETVVEQEIKCFVSGTEAIPLLVNAAAIRDGEQATTGHVFLFTDMTNVRQLEEQLRRSERLASLGRLAAGIAHEIRNPLSSIKGFATLLAKRSGGDEKSLRISQVMVEEVERLNRVVSELLDFARPTELHRRLHSCRELIDRTLQLVDKDAQHRRVEIESAINPEDLQVDVDPDRFAQILLNLYLNALQAMEKGGTLRIEVFQQQERTLFIVSDSGAGIQTDHLPHIFDPYFTTKSGGVGLGLANVHKLVEAHGGEIEVASSPGQGTSFVIRLKGAA